LQREIAEVEKHWRSIQKTVEGASSIRDLRLVEVVTLLFGKG
jgi:hypothetical protein